MTDQPTNPQDHSTDRDWTSIGQSHEGSYFEYTPDRRENQIGRMPNPLELPFGKFELLPLYGEYFFDLLVFVEWFLSEKDETFDAETKAKLEEALRETYRRENNSKAPKVETLQTVLSEMEGETAAFLRERLESRMVTVNQSTGQGIFIGIEKGSIKPVIIHTPMDFTVFPTDPSQSH